MQIMHNLAQLMIDKIMGKFKTSYVVLIDFLSFFSGGRQATQQQNTWQSQYNNEEQGLFSFILKAFVLRVHDSRYNRNTRNKPFRNQPYHDWEPAYPNNGHVSAQEQQFREQNIPPYSRQQYEEPSDNLTFYGPSDDMPQDQQDAFWRMFEEARSWHPNGSKGAMEFTRRQFNMLRRSLFPAIEAPPMQRRAIQSRQDFDDQVY